MIFKNIPKEFDPRFEVVSCFMECDGKILLLHRKENKSEGDKWGVPAGKIEKNEKVEDAAVREILEETGQEIALSNLRFLTTVYVKYPQYDFIYHIFHLALIEFPQIRLSEKEHKDFKWIDPKEILKLNLVRDLDLCVKMYYKVI